MSREVSRGERADVVQCFGWVPSMVGEELVWLHRRGGVIAVVVVVVVVVEWLT